METDSPRLVGFEIDRCSVRAIVLSPDGIDIVAYADSSVMEPGASEDPFPNPGLAISSIWNKLELNQYRELRVAASFGSSQSGIGSGQLIGSWIDAMTEQLGQPIAVVAHENDVISYAPQAHVNTVRDAFQTVGCEPSVIELAPTSVGRMLVARPSCVISIGSAAAWRVRIHDGQILEAVSYPGRVTIPGVAVEYFGQPAEELSSMLGVSVPGALLRTQQLTVGMLAVAVGAATSLLDPEPVGNFVSVLAPLSAHAGQAGSLEEASSNGALAVAAPSEAASESMAQPDSKPKSEPSDAVNGVEPHRSKGDGVDPTAARGGSETDLGTDIETAAGEGEGAVTGQLAVSGGSSIDNGAEVEPEKGAGVVGEVDGGQAAKVATGQDVTSEASSENSFDAVPVSAAKSSPSAPPMPDEQLLTENFVEAIAGFDPTTTAAMTAPPPPVVVETKTSTDDQAEAEADQELVGETKFETFRVKQVGADLSASSAADEVRSSPKSAVAVGANPASEAASPRRWPQERSSQGKVEKDPGESNGMSLPKPVDTQPVPPLAGIQAHLTSSAVDRFAELPSSVVGTGRPTAGFSNGGQASGSSPNKTSDNLAEVGVGPQGRLSAGKSEEPKRNELVVTEAVPDDATAHLEAQLAQEQAWRAAPVNDIHSIQQPGERRADPEPALSLWPFVLLGFAVMLAVAAVLYIWQVAF